MHKLQLANGWVNHSILAPESLTTSANAGASAVKASTRKRAKALEATIFDILNSSFEVQAFFAIDKDR